MIVLYYLDNNNEKEIFMCVEYCCNILFQVLSALSLIQVCGTWT